MTAKPTTQRMAEHRQRRKAQGLTRLELWAHPDDHEWLKQEAKQCNESRQFWTPDEPDNNAQSR